jgi:hypothetical protein
MYARRRSPDISVGIATGYGLGSQGSIRGPVAHPQRVLVVISPGLKWPGREAEHSPPSTAEVKNGGAIPRLRYVPSWHSV